MTIARTTGLAVSDMAPVLWRMLSVTYVFDWKEMAWSEMDWALELKNWPWGRTLPGEAVE